jgi:hypothetical protein
MGVERTHHLRAYGLRHCQRKIAPNAFASLASVDTSSAMVIGSQVIVVKKIILQTTASDNQHIRAKSPRLQVWLGWAEPNVILLWYKAKVVLSVQG